MCGGDATGSLALCCFVWAAKDLSRHDTTTLSLLCYFAGPPSLELFHALLPQNSHVKPTLAAVFPQKTMMTKLEYGENG